MNIIYQPIPQHYHNSSRTANNTSRLPQISLNLQPYSMNKEHLADVVRSFDRTDIILPKDARSRGDYGA